MPKLPPKPNRSWNTEKPKQEGRLFKNEWYHTTQWRKLRASFLQNNPLCIECEKIGIVRSANVVDHVKNVSSGKTLQDKERLMWDINNLQPMCNSCHNSKSGKESKN